MKYLFRHVIKIVQKYPGSAKKKSPRQFLLPLPIYWHPPSMQSGHCKEEKGRKGGGGGDRPESKCRLIRGNWSVWNGGVGWRGEGCVQKKSRVVHSANLFRFRQRRKAKKDLEPSEIFIFLISSHFAL